MFRAHEFKEAGDQRGFDAYIAGIRRGIDQDLAYKRYELEQLETDVRALQNAKQAVRKYDHVLALVPLPFIGMPSKLRLDLVMGCEGAIERRQHALAVYEARTIENERFIEMEENIFYDNPFLRSLDDRYQRTREQFARKRRQQGTCSVLPFVMKERAPQENNDQA